MQISASHGSGREVQGQRKALGVSAISWQLRLPAAKPRAYTALLTSKWSPPSSSTNTSAPPMSNSSVALLLRRCSRMARVLLKMPLRSMPSSAEQGAGEGWRGPAHSTKASLARHLVLQCVWLRGKPLRFGWANAPLCKSKQEGQPSCSAAGDRIGLPVHAKLALHGSCARGSCRHADGCACAAELSGMGAHVCALCWPRWLRTFEEWRLILEHGPTPHQARGAWVRGGEGGTRRIGPGWAVAGSIG